MPKVVLKTLLAVGLTALVTAKGFSEYRGGIFLICVVPVLLAVSAGTVAYTWKQCYRPRENHLGVIYRFGRFHRFVDPDEWAFLLPYIDRVHREVGLYMNTTEVILKKVELHDGLAVDLRLKVFFKTDMRLATPENLLQTLKFEGPEWPEIVKTGLEDVVRNQVFLNIPHGDLNELRRSREIKKRISAEIASRVRGFGIVINQEFGAMVAEVQPDKTYFDAVQAHRAAASLGEAAIDRLRPVLAELKRMRHEDTRAALLLEIASKIAEVKNLPELVLSPEEYTPPSPPLTDRRKPQRPKPAPPMDYPLAN